MVESMTTDRLARWTFAAALGPLTGPLALQALAYYRAGDRVAAFAYAACIPAVWLHLSTLAVLSWT